VDGDIVSPRVAIAEGAHFRGSIDMQRSPGAQKAAEKPAGEAAASKPPAPAATAPAAAAPR
jgi:hypothetical protein